MDGRPLVFPPPRHAVQRLLRLHHERREPLHERHRQSGPAVEYPAKFRRSLLQLDVGARASLAHRAPHRARLRLEPGAQLRERGDRHLLHRGRGVVIAEDRLQQLDDIRLGNDRVNLALQPGGLGDDGVAVLSENPRGDGAELEAVGVLLGLERRAEQRPARVTLKLRRVCDQNDEIPGLLLCHVGSTLDQQLDRRVHVPPAIGRVLGDELGDPPG